MVEQIKVCCLSPYREEESTTDFCLIKTTSTERTRSSVFLSALSLLASSLQ
jgi:hypothetical protein